MMLTLLSLSLVTQVLAPVGGATDAADRLRRSTANREFLINNYPEGALKRGEQGTVGFRLTIETDGSVGKCRVTTSSGYPGLDEETCTLMIDNARLSPVRGSNGRAIRATQNGFIAWQHPSLKSESAKLEARQVANSDEIICKKSPKVGSAIIRVNQCLTASEWRRQELELREEIERIQGKGHN